MRAPLQPARCTLSDSTKERLDRVSCSDATSAAGDARVASLNVPAVALRVGRSGRRRSGSEESRQALLAASAAAVGSAGGRPVGPDGCELVTCFIFTIADRRLDVQMQIFPGVGVTGNLFLLK